MNRKALMAVAILFLLSGKAFSETGPILFDRIDKNHSTIGFTIPIFGGFSEVEGKFTDFSVVVHYNTDLSKASVETVIRVESIDTGNPDRDQDLRGDGFFDVARFPEIRFVSDVIRKEGDAYVAEGTLTLHGVSKKVSLPFKSFGPEGNAEEGWVLGIQSDVVLDRDDYGISWRHTTEAFVGDEVQIKLRLITRLTKPVP